MPSERVQRQSDRLLDEAEQAIRDSDWSLVRGRCEQVLRLDPANADAGEYLVAAERDAPVEQPSNVATDGAPALPNDPHRSSVGARFAAVAGAGAAA
jgi:hypothetical protein